MNRADYEATLRVVLNPTAARGNNSDQQDSEEGIILSNPQITIINRFFDFLDRTGVIINNFNILQKDTNATLIKLQKLL